MAKPPFINDPVGSIQRELNRRGLPSPTPFIPNTRTRTSHALTIRDGATGQLIGAIYTFAPKQARTLEEEYEINRDTRGLPVDIVPQNLTTRTLQIARYDLFTKIMEDVFGHKEMVILTDQKRPFRIRETWRDPAAILGGGRRIYEYTGCWFQDLGRTLSATDDRIVKVDATLMFRDRQRFI